MRIRYIVSGSYCTAHSGNNIEAPRCECFQNSRLLGDVHKERSQTYGHASSAKRGHNPRSIMTLGETGFRTQMLNRELFDILEGNCTTQVIIVPSTKTVNLTQCFGVSAGSPRRTARHVVQPQNPLILQGSSTTSQRQSCLQSVGDGDGVRGREQRLLHTRGQDIWLFIARNLTCDGLALKLLCAKADRMKNSCLPLD